MNISSSLRRIYAAGVACALLAAAIGFVLERARFGSTDADALARAVRMGEIAGAGLDVAPQEPLPPEHLLWTTPNVAITPHLGGQSPEARDRQWRLLRENVRRFVAGEPLLCVVDKQKGY